MTMVREESMVVDTSVSAKSLDTRGTSETAKMPLSSLAAALRKASFTSSARVFFSTWITRSTTDTLGVGTRSAMPAGNSRTQICQLKGTLYHMTTLNRQKSSVPGFTHWPSYRPQQRQTRHAWVDRDLSGSCKCAGRIDTLPRIKTCHF